MPKRGRRRKGEGSIFQRKSDGRWVARVTNEGGKQKAIYGDTADEVVDALARARGQQLDHLPFTDERVTLRHWLQTWLENKRPPMIKPKSWVAYEGRLRLHVVPQLGHIRLRKLQPQDVRAFLAERLEAGLSTSMVRDLRAVLKTALNQAVKDGYIRRNAAALAEPFEVESKPMDVYTPEEARRLLEAARGDRLEALWTTAVAIGLREGESKGLEWDDIDFVRGLLTVRHNLQRVHRVRRGDVVKEGERKTELLTGRPKARQHKLDPPLPLPRLVVESLQRHRALQEEERRLAGSAWKGDGRLVFTTRVGTPHEHLDLEFHRLCDKAALRRIRLHDLRHSAASILIAQGVHPKAIQELLRHRSIQITMDRCGHLFDQVRRETADKMDAVLRNVSETGTENADEPHKASHKVSDKVSKPPEPRPN
jgi:integrase